MTERTGRTGRTRRREIILGIFSGIGMNVNSIIGLGIFTAPGIVWKTLNSPPAAMILWTLGGIMAMAASFSYAEIGATIEQSGGEIGYFWYLGEHYPRKTRLSQFSRRRLSEFSSLVSYVFSFLIIIVILPGKISTQLQTTAKYFVYTGSNNPSEFSNAGLEGSWSTLRINLIAISILIIITGYHIPNSRVAIIINQIIAGIKLIILVIIAIVGFVKLPSALKERSNIWSFDDTKDTKGFETYLSAFISIMFSYDGWNVLNYALDEFKEPRKNLIISNLSSIIIVTILYIFVNIAFMSVVPKELMLDDSKVIAMHFFEELLGEKGGQISSFIIIISTIGTVSLYVFVGSRAIAYAAQRNYIPFFSDKLKWDSSKEKSPKNALISQFMWCSLLIILVKDGISSNFYGSFSNFSWYSDLTIYVLTGFVLFLLRFNFKTKEFRFYKKDFNLLILMFIAGRICGFVIPNYDTVCPENISNCEEYLKNEKIKKQAPYFTGATFIVMSIICYFVIYRLLQKKDDDDSGDGDDDGNVNSVNNDDGDGNYNYNNNYYHNDSKV